MSAQDLPHFDSVREMAAFWDTHDLTDFEEQLVEVVEPISLGERVLTVSLPAVEADAIQRMAKSKGLSPVDLVREWVLEKVRASA